MGALFLLGFFGLIVILVSIRQVNQYERGVVFTLGKFTGIRQPGWRLIVPVFQKMKKMDIRTKTVDVPDQEIITRDNIPANINAVVYYKIIDSASFNKLTHWIIAATHVLYAFKRTLQNKNKNNFTYR